MCWPKEWPEHNMRMEIKYLRLRTPVTLGSRFGDWQVCWLGGWARHRLYYLVMLVKVPLPGRRRAGPPLKSAGRSNN